MPARFPKLIAFDLDFTLWDLWADTHITGPLRREERSNQVVDKYNKPIAFYKDVPEVLHRTRKTGAAIAAVSRTTAPKIASQMLSLLLVPSQSGDEPSKPVIEFFDQLEIFPGSKLVHFKHIHDKTGLPYSEMLFFDDEQRNKEVEKLGVTFCLVSEGIDITTFEKGIEEWRKRHPEEVPNNAST
ncbi:hypothetical protein AX15_002027 [Amanita polypyramis BW_CC]|nr:hypothetical protein AX15_002027 [Amanita polypyramis BW_CC]